MLTPAKAYKLLALIAWFAAAPLPASAKSFLIGSFWPIPTVQVYEEIVAAMYCTAGFEIAFRRYPMARALQEANLGKTDGDLVRYPLIEAKATNLIRVPEPLPPMEVVFMALNSFPESSVTVETSRAYRIGYFQGLSLLESENWNPRSVSVTGSYEQLVSLLMADRIDIMLVGSWDKALLLRQHPDLKEVGRMNPGPPVFHYVHRKHYQEVEALDQALKKLKTVLDLDLVVAHALQKSAKIPPDQSSQVTAVNCADLRVF